MVSDRGPGVTPGYVALALWGTRDRTRLAPIRGEDSAELNRMPCDERELPAQ